MRIVVGIATANRRDVVPFALSALIAQSRLPDLVVVCAPTTGDMDSVGTAYPFSVRKVVSGRGLTIQRNAVLDECQGADAVLFIDDDFLLGDGYIGNLEKLLMENPAIVGLTGTLIADGINGPGISQEAGVKLLAESYVEDPELRDVYCAYGCNMTFRLAPILENSLRFDERLPLYGWQEDLDFSRQIAPFGRVCRSGMLVGVHLGVKSGRASGIRLGYSQIANPMHLARKSTLDWNKAGAKMLSNFLANIVKSPFPEVYVDRRGRLKGNAIAILDLCRGRLFPERAEKL